MLSSTSHDPFSESVTRCVGWDQPEHGSETSPISENPKIAFKECIRSFSHMVFIVSKGAKRDQASENR